ncbi:hypothetical protein TNCV_4419651 [Trichonephila clavipes]|nr:hypothetical protein TNCV_4419651 [Trichonephila clavipes]
MFALGEQRVSNPCEIPPRITSINISLVKGVDELGTTQPQWPPRNPDFTPCDFFLWGYVKEKVPSLPLDLAGLKQRITAAISVIQIT